MGNLPPTVHAEPDQTLPVLASGTLASMGSADGFTGTLPWSWSQVSRSGTGTFANPKVAGSMAAFGTAGGYVLHLMANDEVLPTSDNMSCLSVTLHRSNSDASE